MFVNECKHLYVDSINNKLLKVIKIIEFNLLYCKFLLQDTIVPPTQFRNYSLGKFS